VRGNALADPTVVGLLEPFLVTYWYGHRDDDPPREIIDYVYGRGGAPGPAGGTSNVKILILDSQARFVDLFDAMPSRGSAGPFHETMPRNFAERLRRAHAQLRLPTVKAIPRPIRLPDHDGSLRIPKKADQDSGSEGRSVRIFVRLDDPGMPAYYAPVVEIATPAVSTWQSLAFPDAPRTINADILQSCFRHVYPPGVMERQNKQTMVHWQIAKSQGSLTLEPAGFDGPTQSRYALLRGKVRLTDEGPDSFSFDGTFAAVLSYPPDNSSPRSLRATFEAIYPRHDQARGLVRRFPLTAVMESLPATD
jgi:hypothetical protein